MASSATANLVTIEVELLDGMDSLNVLVRAAISEDTLLVHCDWNVIEATLGDTAYCHSVPGSLEDTLSAIRASLLLTNNCDVGKGNSLPVSWQLKTALDHKLVPGVVVLIP